MHKSIPGICLIWAIASATGEPLPKFLPATFTVVFDKSAKYYQEYQVPEKEKVFTRDAGNTREVTLNAVKFPSNKPLLIEPAAYPNPGSPYEALADFLYAARTRDAGKIIGLHDSNSRKLIEANLLDPDKGAAFFKTMSAIRKVKVSIAFEANGLVVVYGFNEFQDRENLHPWVFVKEGNIYRKKAGAIELGFWQSLGGMLQAGEVPSKGGKK